MFRFQVSGVRFQQKISIRCVAAAREKNVLSPVLTCSYKQIRVQDSVFTDPPPAENLVQIISMAEPSISDPRRWDLRLAKGPCFRFQIKHI